MDLYATGTPCPSETTMTTIPHLSHMSFLVKSFLMVVEEPFLHWRQTFFSIDTFTLRWRQKTLEHVTANKAIHHSVARVDGIFNMAISHKRNPLYLFWLCLSPKAVSING